MPDGVLGFFDFELSLLYIMFFKMETMLITL